MDLVSCFDRVFFAANIWQEWFGRCHQLFVKFVSREGSCQNRSWGIFFHSYAWSLSVRFLICVRISYFKLIVIDCLFICFSHQHCRIVLQHRDNQNTTFACIPCHRVFSTPALLKQHCGTTIHKITKVQLVMRLYRKIFHTHTPRSLAPSWQTTSRHVSFQTIPPSRALRALFISPIPKVTVDFG